MVFACAGKTYDSTDLKAYETANPALPAIYVTRNFDCVFVVTCDRYKGVSVHQADAVEIKALAARYQIDDLLRALPLREMHLSPPAPAGHS